MEVQRKWLETLMSLAEEAGKELENNTRTQIKIAKLIGFASSAKTMIKNEDMNIGKECLTCGGKYPKCICHAKNKMPIWVDII